MIYLKSPSEITKIRIACQIIGELLEKLDAMIEPGINTWELDQYAESFIRGRGGIPAFKGYQIPG
jgi:methionyl aminopeptidase